MTTATEPTRLSVTLVRDPTASDAPRDVRALARRQNGVISREQLVELGVRPNGGRDQVVSGRWQRILPGVYLTNSGEVSFRQRCWAASLYAGPEAAITGAASAYLDRIIDSPPRTVDVVVPHDKRVISPEDWLAIRQTRRPFIVPDRRPAQTTTSFAALVRTQSATSADEVVAILTETARADGTAAHLRAEATAWNRLRWRAVVMAVLAPEEEGHESILEWSFTRLVLRAHHLPEPRRQVWVRTGRQQVRVDGLDDTWGLRIELDGRIHEGKTAEDIWRDNEATVTYGQPTLRFRWRHVLGSPCSSALLVERGYRMRGWPGRGTPCRPDCPVGRS